MWRKLYNSLVTTNSAKTLTIIILCLLVLAFNNRFIQDDAFISFRYAENFAQGHGLTWNTNETEPVEGYTNFLWTLLIAAAIAMNGDPVVWSMILGFIFGLGTLVFTYRASLKIYKSRPTALLSVFLLGTNYTYSSYMTGGLETQLQTFLFIVSLYVSISLLSPNPNARPSRYALLSVIFSLAVMTRLDSVLVCGILFVAVSYALYMSKHTYKEKLNNFISLIAPGALIVGTWFLFKLSYYGDILPNTYYLKAASNTSLSRGLFYVYSFFSEYGLFLFLVIGAVYFRKFFSKTNFKLILTGIICIWLLYVIKVSGDFMEYRFIVPIMPLIYILVSVIISSMPSWKSKAIVVYFLLIFSFYHATWFERTNGIESISELHAHVVDERENWKAVGQTLGAIFSDAHPPVIIGVTTAGAIPYYSKLPSIDMLGLNDKWVARNGLIIGSRPGHTRYTTMQHLIDSKVNFIIEHPNVREISSAPTISPPRAFFWFNLAFAQFVREYQVIEIPLDDKYRVDVLYIAKHPAVDKAINDLGLVARKYQVMTH